MAGGVGSGEAGPGALDDEIAFEVGEDVVVISMPGQVEEADVADLHDTTLNKSLLRYDENLLVKSHMFGQPASANPVLHVKQADASGWFDRYTESFETIWAVARPWASSQEGTPADG